MLEVLKILVPFSVIHIVLQTYLFAEEQAQVTTNNEIYNPWPGYNFTGELRPYPVVSTVVYLYFMKLKCI